ncbi:MAG: formylglycine-generating enzyme family protein [Deltaproteobacteria bacterium]|jgi:formylglycine-generating enzyme required for sulfatase activity|nr:formylglycine-generating enzyme family protein [Deltaproteobacteria bacterium]
MKVEREPFFRALGALALALIVFSPAGASGAEEFVNGLGMKFVLIPAGSFAMGAREGDSDAGDDEFPRHKVTLTRPFYLGTTEVTNGQWREIMGSSSGAADFPASDFSREDAEDFVAKLNAREKVESYRLPTEAEWEYAARAGTDSIYFFGDDSGRMSEYSNCGLSVEEEVGSRAPNPWGLYDIYGNVWEFVSDWYGPYSRGEAVDPTGPESGREAIKRGGTTYSTMSSCRTSYRRNVDAGDRGSASPGLRVAMDARPQMSKKLRLARAR